MKIFSVFLFLILSLTSIISIDFVQADKLYDTGKYQETFSLLNSSFDKSKPDPSIIWRIGRIYFEMSELIKNKKDHISMIDKGLEFLKPYYNMNGLEMRPCATIIYWYAKLTLSKSQAKGIKESLDNIPDILKYCDVSLSTDPSFADPYYLKASINDGIPQLFGGDKFQMSLDITKALSMEPANYWYLVDGAAYYINRNWDVKKKSSIVRKKGKSDGSPNNLSDKEYAKQLLTKALDCWKIETDRTLKKLDKIDTAKKMLQKLK